MSTRTPSQRPSATDAPASEVERATPANQAAARVWAVTRISIGWIFLWAFLDKTFGLGFATPAEGAWINGGSPTSGFLTNATRGPFAESFQSVSGAAWADWLFMIGLLGIGAALILGIGVRIAAAAGALMLVLMWSAALLPENNPFMDDHLIYALVLIGLALSGAGRTWGLGRQWEQTHIVQRYPVLK